MENTYFYPNFASLIKERINKYMAEKIYLGFDTGKTIKITVANPLNYWRLYTFVHFIYKFI